MKYHHNQDTRPGLENYDPAGKYDPWTDFVFVLRFMLFIWKREKECSSTQGASQRKKNPKQNPCWARAPSPPPPPPMSAGSQDQDWDHDLNGIKSLMPNQPVASPRFQLTVFINSFILTLPHPFIYCKPNLFILWPSAK